MGEASARGRGDGRGRRVSARALLIAYAAWMALLVVIFLALPSDVRPWSWYAIGGSSAVAVVVGAMYHRPRRWQIWFLLSLALCMFALGRGMLLVQAQIRQDLAFPTPADALSLAMYPVVLIGIILQPRAALRPDPSGVVDALALLSGCFLLLWVFVIRPHVEPAWITGPQRLTIIAYPAGDLAILGISIALFAGARRAPSSLVMAAGLNALLVADVLFGLSRLLSKPILMEVASIGWVIFAVVWGAAVLVPSMAVATAPQATPEAQFSVLRMAVLTVAAFLPPAALLVESLGGTVKNGVGIAILCGGIFAVVLVRFAGVSARRREAVQRERALREAGAALLSAPDIEAVRSALAASVARLMPHRDSRYRLRMYLRNEPDHPVTAAAGPPSFVFTAELFPADETARRRDFDGFDIALLEPLVIEERPSSKPYIGALVLAADDRTLRVLEPAMQVLAAQAALAIDRMALNDEITRRNNEQYFRTLVRGSADVIILVNADDTIRYASPSAESMFGNLSLVSRPVVELLPPNQRAPVRRLLEAVRSAGPVDGGAELAAGWTVLGAAGPLEVEASVRDLRDDPTVAGLVVTLRDVTEPRRLERELRHRAYHDALTGLPNRLYLGELAQDAVARARATDSVVGVLFVDLDDFKVVNDTMSYEAGDQLLVAVADRLRAMFGQDAVCARLGADEFAILLSRSEDVMSVEEAADRVIHALAEPFTVAGSTLDITASVGAATTLDAPSSGDLLRQADLALYLAKGAGKGMWRRYQSSLHTGLVDRLALRSALDKAITANELVLQYQPIVSIADGTTVGFEALVRWRHATRGMIPPAEFIGVAEDSGLIVPMGGWILAQSMADAAGWSDSPQHGPYVSVNVSVRQFRAHGFVDKVRQELAASGIPAHRLVLEITESLLLHDDERVWLDLAALRRLGVQIAIDDFGTGYSSLSYLRQVPVDLIKVDKSFIDTLSSSPQQRAIVEGIVRLAQTLGLQVVAEGIERASDRDVLLGIGCPLGQGFLYARPMNADQVRSWLHTPTAV